VVDNGSSDFSLGLLHKDWSNSNLRIEILETNRGYAAANNIGARLANGKWLALLNADAFPEPDWLENLLKAAEANPEYSYFTSRQLQANNSELLDGAGDSYHVTGLAWRRFYNKPSQEYGAKTEEVFGACPSAALISREDFLTIGGFDEDYFSYFEDVDLGFRLRLAGKKCLYVPDAVVHHVGSASTGKRSDFSVYYGYRNMIWTFFKNMPSPLLWLFLPLHIATLLFFVIYLSTRGQGRVILRAIRDAVKGLPKMMEKRKSIQKNRKVRTSELLRVMSTGLFEPYLEFIHRNRRK
jgi:GT2 family glycosyltransferase